MVPLPTDNLPLTHMLTEDRTVEGLAVGKGIADRSLLADTFLVGIHPTYADSFPVHIHLPTPTHDLWAYTRATATDGV